MDFLLGLGVVYVVYVAWLALDWRRPRYVVGIDPAGDDYGSAVLIERRGDQLTVVDSWTLD